MGSNSILPNDFPTEKELLDIIMHTATSAWNNVVYERDIEYWLANFSGEVYNIDDERRLALWFLSHFTYYSKKEIHHLCKVLFADLVHFIIQNSESEEKNSEVTIQKFFENSDIISPGKTSDSGGFIAYIFRQENSLPMKLFNFSIKNVEQHIKNLIVIDDVTLTASKKSQSYSFFEEARKLHPDKNLLLLTLIANSEAVNFLNKQLNVQVITPIKLDTRDKCFSSDADLFSPFPQLRGLGEEFARHYGRKSHPEMELGYENGQYAFGFFYNTPDNSLPIFWGKRAKWTPIFTRYHKNYLDSNYLKDERFI